MTIGLGVTWAAVLTTPKHVNFCQMNYVPGVGGLATQLYFLEVEILNVTLSRERPLNWKAVKLSPSHSSPAPIASAPSFMSSEISPELTYWPWEICIIGELFNSDSIIIEKVKFVSSVSKFSKVSSELGNASWNTIYLIESCEIFSYNKVAICSNNRIGRKGK